MYKASKQQHNIRRSARGLYDAGLCLVGEWVKRIPELTLAKWLEWEKQPGFMEWWVELFPEHNGITITDLKALEYEAGRSLMNSLLAGDLKAAQMVVQMVNSAKEAQTINDKGMDEWFNPPNKENGWEKEWN